MMAVQRRARGRPPEADRAEALELANYGEPPGFLGAIPYMLRVVPQRRKNERLLREAVKERQRAFEATEEAYLHLGRRLHELSGQADLTPVALYVTKADHALLHQEQVMRDDRRTKRDRAMAKERAEEALRQLAQNAIEHALGDIDPKATREVVEAVDHYKRLDREVTLREMGVDAYDEGAVQRGAILLILLIALAVAGAAYAWLTRG